MVFILIIKKKSEDKAIQIRSLYSFPKNSENVLYLQKKTENTFLFRVYGRIFIELKYNESDELEFKIKPKPLDIKFKQKFREYLKGDKKLDIFEY